VSITASNIAGSLGFLRDELGVRGVAPPSLPNEILSCSNVVRIVAPAAIIAASTVSDIGRSFGAER
jgi:hypothetical protein